MPEQRVEEAAAVGAGEAEQQEVRRARPHADAAVGQRQSDALALVARSKGQLGDGSLSDIAVNTLKKSGHTRALHSFLKAALARNPDLPLWSEYLATGADRHAELFADLARKARGQ